jgi:hypothetical protein
MFQLELFLHYVTKKGTSTTEERQWMRWLSSFFRMTFAVWTGVKAVFDEIRSAGGLSALIEHTNAQTTIEADKNDSDTSSASPYGGLLDVLDRAFFQRVVEQFANPAKVSKINTMYRLAPRRYAMSVFLSPNQRC